MSKLAIDGGEKVRTKSFTSWPVWDERELNALKEVLESGRWGIGNTKVSEFEEKFAQDPVDFPYLRTGLIPNQPPTDAVRYDVG